MLFRSKLRIPEVALAVLAVGGCGGDGDSKTDASAGDGGPDGGSPEGGSPDGGQDAGQDAGGNGTDAGSDAGTQQDAGGQNQSDAGSDAGAFVVPSDLIDKFRAFCELYIGCAPDDAEDVTVDGCVDYYAAMYMGDLDLSDDDCAAELIKLWECDTEEFDTDLCATPDGSTVCDPQYLAFYNACY